MVEATESLLVFGVVLLVGASGIYVGGRVVTGAGDVGHAIVTALLGSLVWAVASFVFGTVPFVGPVLAFLSFLAVIYWRYPGGAWDALLISFVGWVVVAVVLYALVTLDLTSAESVGVPRV